MADSRNVTGQSTVTSDHTPDPISSRSRPSPPRLILILLGVAVLLAGAFAYVAVRHHDEQTPLADIRQSGLPSQVSTSASNMMGLSPIPHVAAPNFDLIDQKGHALSMSDFRGRTVVLEFMDTHCVDICPLVSQEFVDANRDLGAAASGVVFVAINVNPYHATTADVAAFSAAHQLNSIPSWHFLTGPVAELQAVWHVYGVAVEAPSPNADIIHNSFVYFIDSTGHERYLADPTDEHTAGGAAYLPAAQLASWGHGIALVARSLRP